jgi:hypothetical protein
MGILNGKSSPQRGRRPVSTSLQRPRVNQRPMSRPFGAKRGLSFDEDEAENQLRPTKTLRQTAASSPKSTKKSQSDGSQETIVISDSSESEAEYSSDYPSSSGVHRRSEPDDIIVTNPLTYKDFTENSKHRAHGSFDEGYHSFSSGLGLKYDTKKDLHEYDSVDYSLNRAILDEEDDRNGVITLPPNLNKVHWNPFNNDMIS